MLDIKFIKENSDAVKDAAKNKNIDVDIDALLEIDKKRVELLQKVEALQAEKNDLNEQMKKVSTDYERAEIIARGKDVKVQLEQCEPDFKEIQEKFNALMVRVPTVPAHDAPVGKDEDDNVELYVKGEKPTFDFTPKDHIAIGEDLGIIDFARGVKIAGYRGYYLVGDGAALQMAIMMYALHKMIEKGFTPMIPPTLVKEFALFGSGYFKGAAFDPEEDEIYKIENIDKGADGKKNKESKFLAGTSEPSLLAYHSGEVVDVVDGPLKICGFSPCYRSEIGSHGKDTKGMYRVHEFMKIEQVCLMEADIEKAEAMHEEMVGMSEAMHTELGLPYRKLAICTGDMGAGKYRQFDLEAWMPGLDRWGETGSASNFRDWQSRRLNVKYKDTDGKKQFVYMLNNTALPSARIIIAILENFQQADGSVMIPEVLRPYMPSGKDLIKMSTV